MAIVVKDSFEPLSERSFASSDEPMLVKSDATRVLQQELLRYCQGRVTGRSFLVAGHRGAGKSTLVASAFLEVWNQAQREPGVLVRPILIALHGPSLFPPVEAVPPKPKAEEPKPEKQKTEAARRDASAAATTDAEDDDASARSDKASAPKKADPIAPKSAAQVALEQITLGLHRGVTKEFVRCYYDRMAFLSEIVDRTAPPGTTADAGLDRNRVMSALPADRSLFLVAAQFETELYDLPSAARLLQFYRLAGADANGVLYRVDSGPAARQMISPLLSPRSAASVQGALELVALAGVLEAYRRISGEYTRSDSETDALKQENKRDAAAGGDLKNVVTPIAALLTGSIVTTGLAATTTNLPSALIGGILTALAAALVLKVSTTRTRNRDVTRQFKFVFDLSVATLDRVLPILIERLRKAGLAPVFVVDELDKVKDLGDRMLAMVHHLKKLVAENAFFCFLTDRSYYEQMAAASVNRQYSVEYTYFGRRLFVVYAPEDFERYLRDRIPDPEPASAAPGSAALPGSTDQALTDERAACAIIRWALRHRAQLHMLDLQREIAILHDQKGRITANAGELLSQQRIQIDATFQVAIELTLAEAKLVQAGAERPEFRRLMHDAMYYPTREWLKGKTSLDLTWDTGFKFFEAYLVERTAQDADAAHTPTATRSVMRPFTDGEAEFLFEHVRELADFLSDRPSVDPTPPVPSTPPQAPMSAAAASQAPAKQTPPNRRDVQLETWNKGRENRTLSPVEGSVRNALLVGTPLAVLLRDGPDKYSFGYRMGRERTRPPVTAAVPSPGPEPAGSSTRAVPAVEAPAQEPTPPELRPEPGSPPGVPAGSLSGAAFEAVGVESDAWKAQSAVIRRFADAVLEMQVEPMVQAASAIRLHRDEMVPLAALQSPYCVIAQTPSFGVVEKALERLEDVNHRGTRHASYAEDAFNVGRFHEIVTRSAGTIGVAIACAEVISRAAGVSGSRDRYARGLATISQACQFESLADAEVRVALENVVQQIASDLEVQMAIDLPPAGASGVAEIDSLVQYVRGLSKKTVKPYAASTLADQAWDAVFVRLRRCVESRNPGAPDLIEIVAGTAGRGPTGFIAFDPRRMAAADWTAVLVACRTARVQIARPSDPVPAWLGVFALRALGFRVIPADVPEVLDWLGMTSNLTPHEQSLRDDATSGRFFAQNDGMDTNVVVIRRAVSALFARMRPSTDASEPKAAMLVATAEQLKALLAEGFPSRPLPGPPWLRNAQRNVLAVEMPPEREKDREQIEAELRRALADVQVVYVYGEDRGGMMQPNVVRPRGAEALIKAVR